jgi:hypothetical protein
MKKRCSQVIVRLILFQFEYKQGQGGAYSSAQPDKAITYHHHPVLRSELEVIHVGSDFLKNKK